MHDFRLERLTPDFYISFGRRPQAHSGEFRFLRQDCPVGWHGAAIWEIRLQRLRDCPVGWQDALILVRTLNVCLPGPRNCRPDHSWTPPIGSLVPPQIPTMFLFVQLLKHLGVHKASTQTLNCCSNSVGKSVARRANDKSCRSDQLSHKRRRARGATWNETSRS
jgi:hypothetical protein